MFDDTEIIAEFLAESRENLDALDSCLLALEKKPECIDGIGEVFRTIHTIKGTCGFLGFQNLEKLTHVGETVLGRIRDGNLSPTRESADVLLRMIDCVREMLNGIENDNSDESPLAEPLIVELKRLADPMPPEPDAEGPGEEGRAGPEVVAQHSLETLTRSFDESASDDHSASASADSTPVQSIAAEPSPLPEVSRARTSEAAHVTEAPTRFDSDICAPNPTSTDQTGGLADDGNLAAESDASNLARKKPPQSSSIRVSTELVDQLMDLVGELVLARNQLHTQFSTEQHGDSNSIVQLSRITNELQDVVLQTRLQPIDRLYKTVPRIVRDVAHELGKQVDIHLSGAETEIDRTILDAIRDPLVHVLRNSIDHGLETPQERLASGKPETGNLWVDTFSENGHIILEVRDDGRGLDHEKIRAIAVERLGYAVDEVSLLSDRDLENLVFRPGFSTASSISNISGRGVGMDVVKTNVEQIGGQIALNSMPGGGTTVRMTIPLTLTIVPSLLVGEDDLKVAIPQSSISEILGINAEHARVKIESIHQNSVIRHHGQIIPVYDFGSILGGRAQPSRIEAPYLVVIHSQGQKVGLAVDELFESQEIVVKPIGRCLQGISHFSGVTILGDGALALVLNPPGLRLSDGDASTTRESSDRPESEASQSRKATSSALLVDLGQEQMLIPVAWIARLIEIDASQIQIARGRRVLNIDGQIVRCIDGHGDEAGLDTDGPIKLLLMRRPGTDEWAGLPVENIHELVDVTANGNCGDSEVLIGERVATWFTPAGWSNQGEELKSCPA